MPRSLHWTLRPTRTPVDELQGNKRVNEEARSPARAPGAHRHRALRPWRRPWARRQPFPRRAPAACSARTTARRTQPAPRRSSSAPAPKEKGGTLLRENLKWRRRSVGWGAVGVRWDLRFEVVGVELEDGGAGGVECGGRGGGRCH